MNRKGFTLIELLAVIIVMSIILLIAVPNAIDAYKESRLKVEDTFVKRLSNAIDSYVTLYSDELTFTSYQGGRQYAKPDQENKVTIVYLNKQISDLVRHDLISDSDYINPNNKDTSCNINANIEIYKDSDFVYCYKVKASSLNCLTTNYITKYLGIGRDPYAINTCVWS